MNHKINNKTMAEIKDLKKLCVEIDRMVQDVERDNIGNKWISLRVIKGYIHEIESSLILYDIVPDTLMDLCFNYYFISIEMFIGETLTQINYGISIIKYYEDLDMKNFLLNNQRKKTTINPKYRKALELYKERVKWAQYW
eukprot:141636_1